MEPAPLALRTATWPPIASTRDRTMYRPTPAPPRSWPPCGTAGVVGLPERFEAAGGLVGRHADAVVGDTDPHEALVGSGAHHHRAAHRASTEGVGQKMVEHLPGGAGVGEGVGQRRRHLDDDRGEVAALTGPSSPSWAATRSATRPGRSTGAGARVGPTAWPPSTTPAPRDPEARSTGSPGPGRSPAPGARSAARRSRRLRR